MPAGHSERAEDLPCALTGLSVVGTVGTYHVSTCEVYIQKWIFAESPTSMLQVTRQASSFGTSRDQDLNHEISLGLAPSVKHIAIFEKLTGAMSSKPIHESACVSTAYRERGVLSTDFEAPHVELAKSAIGVS